MPTSPLQWRANISHELITEIESVQQDPLLHFSIFIYLGGNTPTLQIKKSISSHLMTFFPRNCYWLNGMCLHLFSNQEVVCMSHLGLCLQWSAASHISDRSENQNSIARKKSCFEKLWRELLLAMVKNLCSSGMQCGSFPNLIFQFSEGSLPTQI